MRLSAVFFAFLLLVSSAWAGERAATPHSPTKIGELFCYTACADHAQSWRHGWQLALDEINKAGGVLGNPLEVLSRDDKGTPDETIRSLEELYGRDRARIFFGTLFSHTSLAASDFSKRNRVLFVKGFDGSNTLTERMGHDLFFQFGPSTRVLIGPLAEKAAASGKKRWAFVAPDYETGRIFVEQFQRALKDLNPNVEFVETQWFPLGKLNAGLVTQTIAHSNPDGIFAVAMSGDYARFVREGNKRKLFDNRMVVGPLAGDGSYIKPLGKEAPVGWLSAQGYPVEQITDPVHKKFIDRYNEMFGSLPDLPAFYAYSTLKVLADAINAASTDDPQKVAEVMRQRQFSIPDGILTFRRDNISNRGTWVGTTGFYNGVPTILNPEYIKPDKYLLSVEEVLIVRGEHN